MGQLWGWGGCETGRNNGAAKGLGCYGALWEWGGEGGELLCTSVTGGEWVYRSGAVWGSNGIWEGLWTPMGTVASGCLWGL